MHRPDRVLIAEMRHTELTPFVREYLSKRTFTSVAYMMLNMLALVAVTFQFTFIVILHESNFLLAFSYLCMGVGFTFLIIPIHEAIHAIAYKLVGAKDVSFDVNWKKFYFMALADGFEADRSSFRLVALAPFVVISMVAILLMFFVSPLWILTCVTFLLVHTAFCSGDFGLMSFFDVHSDKQVTTVDDLSVGSTYFYEVISENKNEFEIESK